ncbi:unnamed protein product [Auanema sp. JU1783]|nr:unnamed protein product [Auanema sp. JU1783]
MPIFGNYYRIIIIIVSFLCLTSICSNYNIINFTFICMKDDYSITYTIGNQTRSVFDYTTTEKSYILWAVALGTLIGTFPINYLYTLYGAKYPFFICGMLSVVSTALTPLAAETGLKHFLFIRFLQGLAYSADFAAIGLICVRWAPLSELAIFIGILISFTPFSSIVTNSVTGQLCVTLGWRSSYYFHALAGFVIFTMWLICYKDDPKDCHNITDRELYVIQKGKTKQHIEGKSKTVPYLKLITDPTILSVWFTAFVEMSVIILIVTYTPIYFHRVLGYSIQATGFIVAVSTLSQIPFKVVAAVCSDKIKCVSEISKIFFFNTLAVGIPGLILCFVGYIDPSYATVSVIAFTFFHCFSSMNCGGFYKCGTLTSRQYAHVVIGMIQWMKCVALFTSPFMVRQFVEDETSSEQWTPVYLICGILLLTANFTAYVTFTDKPASYTKDEEVEKNVEEEGKVQIEASI